jgi:hypothetical protein
MWLLNLIAEGNMSINAGRYEKFCPHKILNNTSLPLIA